MRQVPSYIAAAYCQTLLPVFSASVYANRRDQLSRTISNGVVLFMGARHAPMNYPHNWYPFRQDSSFLYYWGHPIADLAALVDADEGRHILFADSPSVDDVIWSGPQPEAAALADRVGAHEVRPSGDLEETLRTMKAAGRRVHYEPPYRVNTQVRVESLLGLGTGSAPHHASTKLIRAIVRQRSVKESREVRQIESALQVSHAMHTAAMRLVTTGALERDIAGHIEGIAIAGGGRLAFPCILTRRGEILHNHYYGNRLRNGDLVVHDSGASSPMQYASDITRTIPVSGTFSARQRAIYSLVLRAQEAAIGALRPGYRFLDAHLLAARSVAADLKDLGLMHGDTDEAVAQGAHALFFPHGLGHMMGLDVHDMEGLGEDLVGYGDSVKRSDQFGLAYLRLARALRAGHVITVEPGCYFIGALIDQWRAKRRHAAFINYAEVERWRTFGGVRIEDDVLVTPSGSCILGPPIPKAVLDVEAACAA